MKKLLAVILMGAMAISLIACGKQGSVDDGAGIREYNPDENVVYIDDEYTALIGSLDAGLTAEESARAAQLNQMTKAAFNACNEQRKAVGLPLYVWSDELAVAAQVRAKECVQSFSHVRPDGTTYWTVNSKIVYAENLAKNYFDAPSVVSGWMNSPTHRANVLDSTLRTLGIALYEDANGTLYWAQEFGY